MLRIERTVPNYAVSGRGFGWFQPVASTSRQMWPVRYQPSPNHHISSLRETTQHNGSYYGSNKRIPTSQFPLCSLPAHTNTEPVLNTCTRLSTAPDSQQASLILSRPCFSTPELWLWPRFSPHWLLVGLLTHQNRATLVDATRAIRLSMLVEIHQLQCLRQPLR